jgi:hypothetical protein
MNATPVLTSEHLTLNDARVLCAALGIPPVHSLKDFPTDTNALEGIWHRLRHTTNVPVMIACAALRGKTQRLTPDPRLTPKPHAPLPHAPKRAPGTPAAPRRAPPEKPLWTNPAAVVVSVIPNPKKKGSASYARFALYAPGRTVAELLAAGLERADLSWDGPRQHVTFALPVEE